MNVTATPEILTAEVFGAFARFINQRPGLDPRNYEGRRAYRSDSRKIQQDGKRARAALQLAQAYPFNAAALLEASSAYSGRLSIVERDGATALEYCTGQYWPMEYRIAAAVVLERYREAIRPKTISGRIPRNISELKEMASAAGSHFFSRDSMRFFGSKILPTIYTGLGGVFFVTSEQHANDPRRFTVRRYNPATGHIDTLGEPHEMGRSEAQRAARRAAAAAVPLCHICAGGGLKYDKACWHCKGTKTDPQTNA